MRKTLLITFLPLLLAGCGGATHHSGVATAGGRVTPTAAADYDALFVQFAHCMRAHGIADFPDPVHRAGHSGLSLSFPDDVNPTAGPGKAANTACQPIIQPVIDMKMSHVADDLTPARLQGLTRYSRCMRAHQIPLLDPDPRDGHISFGQVSGLTDPPRGRRDPLFTAADTACRSVLPAGVSDDGTGPP